MRSDAPEQPELCPHELDSNGAELDLFEFELSEPTGSGAVITLASLPISGLFERLPTENARTLLASCGTMSNLPCKQQPYKRVRVIRDVYHALKSSLLVPLPRNTQRQRQNRPSLVFLSSSSTSTLKHEIPTRPTHRRSNCYLNAKEIKVLQSYLFLRCLFACSGLDPTE